MKTFKDHKLYRTKHIWSIPKTRAEMLAVRVAVRSVRHCFNCASIYMPSHTCLSNSFLLFVPLFVFYAISTFFYAVHLSFCGISGWLRSFLVFIHSKTHRIPGNTAFLSWFLWSYQFNSLSPNNLHSRTILYWQWNLLHAPCNDIFEKYHSITFKGGKAD